ncbi:MULTISPECIES: fatty acid desaturase [Mycolicibacter]|uniref:Fatty acid desaturase n=2 Tax=Mycolicibacter TaxID=1073531 RepID=A0ABU5XM34_9MYCO|nr:MULTISPECIES: fatty acid desaturase [unclassified Mycolicibacter]MEB3023054.1 fatty acid desaturase [Mycolicibacter sp. MYC098]MEB3033564.1 fatty acid desaturase [Mycolicibacter sp. MYC340]
MPAFSWPTFGLAVGGITAFVLVAIGAAHGTLPAWVVVPASTLVTYVMFSVAHEALHRSFCSVHWVNAVVGRIAWLLVVLPFSLPAFGYVHGEHHRHTNDPERDPDMFATHAPTWQLPFRWALLDLFNATWYVRKLRPRIRHSWQRPVAELAETSMLFSFTVAMTVAAILTDHFWLFAEVVLIPQRLGLFIIGWAFDWLPHHDIDITQREDRYRASRIRVGMEWLLAPLMLSQNYHLVHHLHPWLPFYRYLPAWRRNANLYLEHAAAVTTVLGRDLNPEEYRHWKRWAQVEHQPAPVPASAAG